MVGLTELLITYLKSTDYRQSACKKLNMFSVDIYV